MFKILYSKINKLPLTKFSSNQVSAKLKFVKGISVLIAVGIFASGCNVFFNRNPETDVVNTISDNGDISGSEASKIIVWGLFETNENIDPLFSRFEAELGSSDNPEQTDVIYVKKDRDEYIEDLDEALNDADPNISPDVFMIHSSWLEKYKDKISNIPSNTLSSEHITNNFHAFLANTLIDNEQVKGVPLWVDLLGLVYNKDHLIQDAGATVISEDWNQFLLQAQNMTKYDETGKVTRPGFSAGESENVEFSFEFLDLLFLQARQKPIAQAKLNVPYSADETVQIQNALNWYKSFTTGEKKTWSKDFKLDTALFIEGKLSAVVLPSWRILDILAYKQQYDLDLDFGVSKMPQLNPSSPDKVYYSSYWIYVVSSDSSNSINSYKLLEFITRKEEQEYYIKTVTDNGRDFALLSPLKSVAETQGSQNEFLKPYFDSTENALNWEIPDGELVGVEYEKLLNNETNLEDMLTYIDNLNNPN